MRIHVAFKDRISDGRETEVVAAARSAGAEAHAARVVDVYLVRDIPMLSPDAAEGFFADAVAQDVVDPDGPFYRTPWSILIEVTCRPGVANPVATSIRDALTSELGPLPSGAVIQTARQYLLHSGESATAPGAPDGAVTERLAAAFHNPLIQQATVITRAAWDAGQRPPELYPVVADHAAPPVARIDLRTMDDDQLLRLSRERLLALDLREMRAIRAYYNDPDVIGRRSSGPGPAATDVELEMIAQTWSEHCKHKIFAARISYTEAGDAAGAAPPVQVIDGLFRTCIRDTTRAVMEAAGDMGPGATARPFVLSVFDDNSGVIAFDDETSLCFKAETHNSPSALDPYGGAITGIVGVNRDILGTGKGARPIFNTDVLCFGYPDTPPAQLPGGLLHPAEVLRGVHRGIVDGGNQSGIPVAAGAFLFDESYVGKPLVFCGTGGILPATIGGEESWIKHVRPGDLAVMVGGRIGKDGIHGATFSSLGLDESSPTSAVQIGEPITQRKMADFLLEARDRLLYSGITDNGAGGLSSSLGEMARESGGIQIDLDACPTKYAGLAAWEILVSESQERMSLSVPPESLDALLELAARRGVEATVVGRFTDSGVIRVVHDRRVVGQIDLDFLHDGLPQMELTAIWEKPRSGPAPGTTVPSSAARAGAAPQAVDPRSALLALLRDPNIGSKEHLVRQYDHEVQGASIVKPQCGTAADGPSDGAVLKPVYGSWQGITVTHGICPRYGDVDTYHMAVAAVDEAVRAHVALGGDPARMAALDNFCWPDPVRSETTPDGEYKLAQLVRACRGLADACRAYHLPLISGKDSMKNDSYLGGRKVSIRPTLLVSLMGIVPDVRRAMTTGFKAAGDRVLIIGSGEPALGGSAYERLVGGPLGGCPATQPAANAALYRALHRAIGAGLLNAVHDVSDGGLGVALAECAIGGRLGARVVLPGPGAIREIFGERTGTFVATCPPANLERVVEVIGRSAVRDVGEVTEGSLTIQAGSTDARWEPGELLEAWHAFNRSGRQGGVRASGAAEPEAAAPAFTPATVADAGPGAGAVGDSAPSAPSGNEGRAVAESRGRGRARPTALLLAGYGINADRELAEAFRRAGAVCEHVHVNELLADPARLARARILAFPGGFSYGDHVGSGRILAHRLRAIREQLERFRRSGRLMIGICNGFQVLTNLGILPDLAGEWRQEVSLVFNDHGRFEDSWVTILFESGTGSPWLAGLSRMDVPIRHGEGRFVTASPALLDELRTEKRIAARYLGRNPNGSEDDISAILDRTGCVLGMMPHPEAFLVAQNHPHWGSRSTSPGQAAALFANAVDHARRV